MSALDDLRSSCAKARAERTALSRKLEVLSNAVAATSDPARVQTLHGNMDEVRAEMNKWRGEEVDKIASQLDPRQWIGELNANVPILLLPLRIQTRFVGTTLFVRAYPDTVSVQSHDPRLSANELQLGQQFWAASDTETASEASPRRNVWRLMVKKLGLTRAEWVMQATNPQVTPAPQQRGGAVRIPAAWTLPERLIFRFYNTDDFVLGELSGNPIPDGLEMGLDISRPALGITRADGELNLPQELLWHTDFDAAERVGMGLRVDLTSMEANGRIARIVVLGVRLANDEQESAQLFERLIEDHRYSDGIAIVPQGTPTNVTEDGDATPPDPDAALNRLRSSGVFKDAPGAMRYEEECDGLRFAHALGIAPDVMRYVEHADQFDAQNAIAMSRALWAGTFGYYVQQMLSPYLEDPRPNRDEHYGERLMRGARFLFTHFVFGSGPLPAIRVGAQPYGVLPVSGGMLSDPGARIGAWGEPFVDDLMAILNSKIRILLPLWRNAIWSVARAGAGDNADQRLIDVLSLQASSVEYHGERLIGLDFLREYANFSGKLAQDSVDELTGKLSERWATFRQDFRDLFATELTDGMRPKIFDLSFFGGVWSRLVGGVSDLNRTLSLKLVQDVIDNLPLSETGFIDAKYPDYLAWLRDMDFATVRAGLSRTLADGTTEPVTALLYTALRYSYLYEYVSGMISLYHHFQGKSLDQFREKELYNVLYDPSTTYWDLLEEVHDWSSAGVADPQTVLQLFADRNTLVSTFADWNTFFGDVDELHRSLGQLAKMSTASLERLFAEHLDMAGYRLDAWITGLVYQRLIAARIWRDDTRADRVHPLYAQAGDAPLRYDLNHRPVEQYARGLYLGAYGWVEDIQRRSEPVPADALPPELKPRNGGAVNRDLNNYGFIHAPSLSHANTAAILRSASVTEPDQAAFNIDLSSRRVRDALWMIDGVRNGQTPAALLGYRFERALRDSAPDALKKLPSLRERFPMPRPTPNDGGQDQANESVPASNVVNGLDIVQRYRAHTLEQQLAAPEFVSPEFVSLVNRIAGELDDTLDACGDLMLAESVHQAAQGNYERAGAVVTASGEFTHIPDSFEVIETLRSGTGLTHRVLALLNADAPPAAGATPRARLAPELNGWLSAILGPLSQITTAATYIWEANGAHQQASYAITLDQLGAAPIDLLYLLDDTASGELAARIDLIVRTKWEMDHPQTAVERIEIDLLKRGQGGTRSFAELLPLIGELRKLLTTARPLTRRDLVTPKALHGAKQDEIEGIDKKELTLRVLGNDDATASGDDGSLLHGFAAALNALETAAASDAQQLTTALLNAAAFGVREAVPAVQADPAKLLSALNAQVARVKAGMKARFDVARSKIDASAAATTDLLALCRDVTNTLLGSVFPLTARVAAIDSLPSAALPDSAALAPDANDWLFSAASVREHTAHLQYARLLAETTASTLPALQVFQWPATQKFWAAGPIPAGQRLQGDIVSIVAQPNAGFDASKTLTGLVIDEWQELVPNEREITGIAFNYDAPNAEPPNALLLAVCERPTVTNGNWSWGELAACVEQSLLLAKMRAVGPDELRHTELDAVLPATLAAEAPAPVTITASYVSAVSKAAAQMLHDVWTKT